MNHALIALLVTGATSASATAAPIDLASELRALAARLARERAASTPPPSQDITAVGPCTRPTAGQRARLAATIAAWIVAETPGEQSSDPPDLQFGCIDRGGAVVDVHLDTIKVHAAVGHWWVVRVDRERVVELASTTGLPLGESGEFLHASSVDTIALADLDHDGIADVVVEHSDREGGARRGDVTLSLVVSSTGKTREITTVDDSASVATGALSQLVLALSDVDHPTVYRCLETNATLTRCADAVRARRVVDADGALTRLAGTGRNGAAIPDRESLAEDLELVGASASDAAPLLAAATPTSPALHAKRAIDAMLDAAADSTNAERDTSNVADTRAYYRALHASFGDDSCAPTGSAAAALVARVSALEPAAPTAAIEAALRCAGPAGTYVLVQWPSVVHESAPNLEQLVVFVARDNATMLAAKSTTDGLDGEHSPQALDVRFYRHGPALIATIIDDHKTLTAYIDGRQVATRTGAFERYTAPGQIEPFDALVVDRTIELGKGFPVLHVANQLEQVATLGDPLDAPVPTGPAAMLVARDRAAVARDILTGLTEASIVAERVQVVAALRAVGAEPAVIRQVVALER